MGRETKLKTSLLLLFAVLMILQQACEEASDDLNAESDIVEDETPADPPKELVSFFTEAGGELKIAVFDNEKMLVSVNEPARSVEVLERFGKREADLSELYVQLTADREVPDSVVRMNNLLIKNRERSLSQIGETINDRVISTENEPDEASLPKENLVEMYGGLKSPWYEGPYYNYSRQQFRDYFCGGVTNDTTPCRTNRTGDSWIYSGSFHWMWSAAYSYRGTILHQLDRKRGLGSYRKVHDQEIEEDWMSYYYWDAEGVRDRLKCRIRFASGDGYHHCCFAD